MIDVALVPAASPTGLQMHSGFLHAMSIALDQVCRSVLECFHAHLDDHEEGSIGAWTGVELWICGHSLGGAYART